MGIPSRNFKKEIKNNRGVYYGISRRKKINIEIF